VIEYRNKMTRKTEGMECLISILLPFRRNKNTKPKDAKPGESKFEV
jgi:hypothetical protein